MADAKKKKISEINADAYHTPEKFKELYTEWEKYHGKIEHPDTGKEVTKRQLMDEELGNLVQKTVQDLKDKVGKGNARDRATVEKHVYELGKKAYMAQNGIEKEPTDKEKKRDFDQRVKDFMKQMAGGQRGGFETYEHLIAEIMAADNPIYGTSKDQRSSALDRIIQMHAQSVHKPEHDELKGLSFNRLNYVESDLSSRFYKKHWMDKHGGILKDYGYAADFVSTASSGEIMGTVAELLSAGETNPKATHIQAKHYKRPKPTYKK